MKMKYDFIPASKFKQMATKDILESIAVAIRVLEVTRDDYEPEMLKKVIRNETSILTLI